MATNIVGYMERTGYGKWNGHFLGAAGVGASDDGYWLNVSHLVGMTMHITGINGDTVQIFGCDLEDEPTDATDHVQLGGDITVNQMIEIAAPVEWLKVKVTRVAGTAVKAELAGRERGI